MRPILFVRTGVRRESKEVPGPWLRIFAERHATGMSKRSSYRIEDEKGCYRRLSSRAPGHGVLQTNPEWLVIPVSRKGILLMFR
jgi:hypothetical protein